ALGEVGGGAPVVGVGLEAIGHPVAAGGGGVAVHLDLLARAVLEDGAEEVGAGMVVEVGGEEADSEAALGVAVVGPGRGRLGVGHDGAAPADVGVEDLLAGGVVG